LGALAFLAAQTGYTTQPWTAPAAQINVPSGVVAVGSNLTVSLQGPSGLDLSGARVLWEAQDQQPAFGPTFTFAPVNNGAQWVEVEAQLPDGRRVFATNSFVANSPNLVWVNGAVPAGATTGADGGDTWDWVSNNPAPNLAPLDQQSAIASGEHQAYFYDAGATLLVSANSTFYAYVYLDPANVPNEVMLQWYDGTGWEHRAYWGADDIAYGTPGTVSRYYAGPLPAAGQWAQLEVPAGAVGLQGVTISGMAFTLYGGRATWDQAGCLNPITSAAQLPIITVTAASASLSNSQSGTFTITSAAGATNIPLAVTYSLGGSAVAGQDYQAPQPVLSATIPAGATSTILNIVPIGSTNIVPSQSVSLTLAAGANYQIGTPGSATLFLPGNSVAVQSLRLTANGPSLSWNGLSGGVYRVAYKNSLTDPNWLYSNPFTATNGLCAWTDTNKPAANQRFYLVLQAN
jgi:hypothetical protein